MTLTGLLYLLPFIFEVAVWFMIMRRAATSIILALWS